MTEPATPKPFLTRRRVIVGAVGVMMMVGMLILVVGLIYPNEKSDIEVKVVGFKSYWARSTVALITVTNTSKRGCAVMRFDSFENGLGLLLRGQPTNYLTWHHDGLYSRTSLVLLNGFQGTNGTIWLPNDGQARHVMIGVYEGQGWLSLQFERLRSAIWVARPYQPVFRWVRAEQLVQCPKARSDRTMEPPRLVSAPGAKP